MRKKLEIKITTFTKKVISQIKKIPSGQVATYGQIAKLSGQPSAARQVGWILNSCTKKYKLPWQRVINSKGQISFKKDSQEFSEQKRLLQQEGVTVSYSGEIELATFQTPVKKLGLKRVKTQNEWIGPMLSPWKDYNE